MPLSRHIFVAAKPALSSDHRSGLKAKLSEVRRSKHGQQSQENETQAAAAAVNASFQSLLQPSNNNNNNSNSQHYQQHATKKSLEFSYLLGESLASLGNLHGAFDVYELVASQQRDSYVPLDKLNRLASALTTYIRQLGGTCLTRQEQSQQQLKTRSQQPWERELRVPSPALAEDYDPLLCPLCCDILRSPVTTNCGHTFCQQCCDTITMCNICHIKFPRHTEQPSSMPALTSTSSSSSAASGGYMSVGSMRSRYLPALAAGTNTAAAAAASAAAAFASSYAALRQPSQPLTVTTTTVACTTATATTTMASTSAAAAAAGGLSYVATAATRNVASTDAMKFMPDVLVRRLVEKWWGADLQAKKINESASSYMHLNLLDDALKFCNASLEKAPSNFESLCLRGEVLLKLSHCESSLADIENALRTRCTSAKAHYLRALALSELGRQEEALYNVFLSICLDKLTNLSNSEIFQHDLAKVLQRLLAQTPKNRLDTTPSQQQRSSYSRKSPPYALLWQRRKQHALDSMVVGVGGYDVDIDVDEDEFGVSCDRNYDNYIMADEESAHFHISNGDFMFPSALDYMDQHYVNELHNAKEFELQVRRLATRKHCRRKWPEAQSAEQLLPALQQLQQQQRHRCSRQLSAVVERMQLELQRLRKLEASANAAPHRQLTAVPAQLIDASDFECVLCRHTLWKPVVTPCGHTYCLVCLDRCMDYNSPCPLCMSPLVELNVNNNLYQGSSSPVPFALAKRPVTKFLEAAMKRFIPDHYEARFHQEIDQEPSVPVFICTAAFPAVPCPLFVCDPRYRLMVRRAVKSGDKTFGIVQPHSGKSRYYDVGTILDIRDCVLLGDGCSILSTIGCKRFKILARSEKDGYETAKVEYICDEPIPMEQYKALALMHNQVLSKASQWFDSLSVEQKHEILQSSGEMPPLEENWELISDGPAWAWWIIALLPLCQQLKVDILATTSLEKRLRAIEKTLDWLHELSQQQQQQQQQQLATPTQPTHELSTLDCENQAAAAAVGVGSVDECCLYASDGSEQEELLL